MIRLLGLSLVSFHYNTIFWGLLTSRFYTTTGESSRIIRLKMRSLTHWTPIPIVVLVDMWTFHTEKVPITYGWWHNAARQSRS